MLPTGVKAAGYVLEGFGGTSWFMLGSMSATSCTVGTRDALKLHSSPPLALPMAWK
jgi:hypothetical protein